MTLPCSGVLAQDDTDQLWLTEPYTAGMGHQQAFSSGQNCLIASNHNAV